MTTASVSESIAPALGPFLAVVATVAQWTPERPLRDPFCGAGTLLIETVGADLRDMMTFLNAKRIKQDLHSGG